MMRKIKLLLFRSLTFSYFVKVLMPNRQSGKYLIHFFIFYALGVQRPLMSRCMENTDKKSLPLQAN